MAHQMTIPMQAVNTEVLCVQLEQQTKAGQIVMAKGVIYSGPKFEVVSVGLGRVTSNGDRVPVCCKVGDYIMSAKGGIGFETEGQKYVTMDESAIECIVRAEDYNPYEAAEPKLIV